jgi:Cytochrome c7 and related cytochrome c
MKTWWIAFLTLAAGTAWAAGPQATSCIQCHGSDMFDAAARAKVQGFPSDVHAQVGLSCHDCHGGNPDPKLGQDMGAAMDSNYKPNPFRGSPKRAGIPEFCGRCHSSAAFMKRFNPGLRVDQVTEYWTSKHGELLKKGDANVATCIDCHSVHDIRRKSQPESPVYPTHVAETCSRCHSDARRMASYGIPTDQYARWRVSVHANAMFNKDDLSAPTCNDCHGNHGATPPGVDRVVFVCGNCHLREAELFRASAKLQGWNMHNDLLASGTKCGDCHDDQRATLQVARFNECITCHENHAIIRPSVAMFGALPETPCAFCHEGVGPLANVVAEPVAKAEHYQELRKTLMATADRLHLTGAARFDWLVDQAQQLPTHKLASVAPDAKTSLRPEFARLFEKFRIGKSHYTLDHVTVDVRRCIDCHPAGDPNGMATANEYVSTMRGLTGMIARAERILLEAQRGGVEVRKTRAELDAAVDNQIEIETLVHTFTPAAERKAKAGGDPLQKKAREGLDHARAALIAGSTALDELSYRRHGLFVALGIIVLALAALALKIRTL